MSVRLVQLLTGRRAGWFAAGVVISVVILGIVGYRAVNEWQDSAARLAQRRVDTAADQLVTAITRDMRGVQSSVLATLPLDEVTPGLTLDLSSVASAFARYPYADFFFASVPGERKDWPITYYVRTDRMPSVMTTRDGEVPFPVSTAHAPLVDRLVGPILTQSAVEGRQFAVFDMDLGNLPYQVVAFLRYTDATRERVESTVGFGVDLDWVRKHYFQDIVTQVLRMQGPEPGLLLRVVDDSGGIVVETGSQSDGPSSGRAFPLLFFNPNLITIDPPPHLARQKWTALAITADDPALKAARGGARRTMSIAAASALLLAFGFAFTLQAVRANAKLMTMKSEFVSAVTHELKTPIATIRAAAETLASGRHLAPQRSREYAELAVRESKRLTRLIDNLLAYSRITELTEAYSFELLDAGALIRYVLLEFESQLTAAGFHVAVDVPETLPAIRADRPAMALALGNLIDNAIRHSRDRRELRVSARTDRSDVVIDVQDAGVGISPTDLPRVTQRFFRGESASSGGSGLGLAIVQRIVGDHRGTLSISSDLGVGTTVTLRMPQAGGDRETTHLDS